MKGKTGVLGPRSQVLAFHALGLDAVFAEDTEAARAAFEKMLREDYALIYLAEEFLPALRAQVERCSVQPLPAVILLPCPAGGAGAAAELLRGAVLRAVGADIT